MRRLAHSTLAAQKHALVGEVFSDFTVGARVATVDGYPGRITAVLDGPFPGTEGYEVILDGGIGGGQYSARQLRPLASHTAAQSTDDGIQSTDDGMSAEAATLHLAAEDYPELSDILHDRPPNERVKVYASRRTALATDLPGQSSTPESGQMQKKDQAAEQLERAIPQVEQVEPPDACSFCGHDQFENPTNTGRGTRMECAQCGGTMTSWGGQWQPDPPSSPENAASRQGDPRATINDLSAVHSSADRGGNDQPSFTHEFETQGPAGYATKRQTVHGPFYHGGRARLRPGAMIEPGRKPNSWGDDFDDRGRSNHAYFTTEPSTASSYARSSSGHLYEVEPTGEAHYDGGGGDGSYKTKHPLRVIRRIPQEEWEHLPSGRTEEAPPAPDHLARRGREFIDHFAAREQPAYDPDLGFHLVATWADVRRKAKAIKDSGGVRILAATGAGVVGEVQGEHHLYESSYNYVPGTRKVADWGCGCKWGGYAWGRSPAYKRFEGRQCSHVTALQYEAQSRGMFGREVQEDRDRLPGQYQRSPVTVQYDRAGDANLNRRTVPPGNMRRTFSSSIHPDSEYAQQGHDETSAFDTAIGRVQQRHFVEGNRLWHEHRQDSDHHDNAYSLGVAPENALQNFHDGNEGREPSPEEHVEYMRGAYGDNQHPLWNEVEDEVRKMKAAPQQHESSLASNSGSPSLSWDDIGDRHPHLYGDPEVHGEQAKHADGEGIGWAAARLAFDHPDHHDEEQDGQSYDLRFHEEEVDPRHIDHARHGANDPRVAHAAHGYATSPEHVPPTVLVHRHGVYQVADGHHRAEGAKLVGAKVRAYVAYSPHEGEPFHRDEDDEAPDCAPFHGAEPHPGVAEHRDDQMRWHNPHHGALDLAPVHAFACEMIRAKDDPDAILTMLAKHGVAQETALQITAWAASVVGDADGGSTQPGQDIPGLTTRNTTELKKKPHHHDHHTNDSRRHAPEFGRGIGWNAPGLMWCDQCNGSGCGHCGGTGQVMSGVTPTGGPGVGDLSTTTSPVADDNPSSGEDTTGGISATGGLQLHQALLLQFTADYAADSLGGSGMDQTYRPQTQHSNSQNPGSTGWATSADPGGWVHPIIGTDYGITSAASAGESRGPTYFHGTTRRLTEVTPASQHGRGVMFPSDTDHDHAYATTDHDDAWHYAEKAWHASDKGVPRVYEVRPRGPVEKDPEYDEHGRSRSNMSSDVRSRHGFDVVREVPMPERMGTPEEWGNPHEGALHSAAEHGASDICGGCGEHIHATGDYVAPWVHSHTGNSFCDVQSTNDAAMLAGSPLHRPEAEPIMHEASVEGQRSLPEYTHAGLALKAADTGRVLMIQRSIKDDKDPARGTWEFPGGGKEPGDKSSLHTGVREWEEEVGHPFPEGGHVSHTWRAGTYHGHVVTIPSESQIQFAAGRSTVNPDDPGGDDHEQSAWWHPADAKKNPALRQELKTNNPFGDIAKAAGANGPTPELTFHHQATDPFGWGHTSMHEIEAHHEGRPVGALSVHAGGYNDGMIDTIRVEPEYQRRGVADALWGHAKSLGIPIWHSDNQSPDAQAWQRGSRKSAGTAELTATLAAVSTPCQTPEVIYDTKINDRTVGVTAEMPMDINLDAQQAETLDRNLHNMMEMALAPMFPPPYAPPHKATLNDEPEPALPSTDGGVEDDPAPEAGTMGWTPGDPAPGQYLAAQPEIPWGYPGGPSPAPLAVAEASFDEVPLTELVAAFQATAAGQKLVAEAKGVDTSEGAQDENAQIAAMARAVLAGEIEVGANGISKSAMKEFSFAEQQDLISEGAADGTRARNFSDLDISGTHYALLGEDVPEEQLWL